MEDEWSARSEARRSAERCFMVRMVDGLSMSGKVEAILSRFCKN
jgi:hypothetical protein